MYYVCIYNILIFVAMSLLDSALSLSLSCTTSEQMNETQSVQGSPLFILPLPNNRVMKLYAIYSILHISFHNIFIEKGKM